MLDWWSEFVVYSVQRLRALRVLSEGGQDSKCVKSTGGRAGFSSPWPPEVGGLVDDHGRHVVTEGPDSVLSQELLKIISSRAPPADSVAREHSPTDVSGKNHGSSRL